MTKHQEWAVERLTREAKKAFFLSEGNYEFKTYDVHETEYGHVCLIMEVGMKGDEGTYASLFCRERVQLFIGPRGGVHYYKTKMFKNGKVSTTRQRYTTMWKANEF